MATKVTMPQMGESIFEGTITKWLKKVGDTVVRDEPLFEISTDKVDSEIPSPASGVLSQILVPEGKTVQINTVLAIINGEGAEEKPAAITASDKVAAQKTPEEAGTPKTEILPVFPQSEKPELPLPVVAPSKPAQIAPDIRTQDIRTSPLVRRLARENNIDLSDIRGTGLEGRITKEDVLNYLGQHSPEASAELPPPQPAPVEQPETAEGEPAAPRTTPTVSRPPLLASKVHSEVPTIAGDSETVPMTTMRKAIAEHMVLSKRTSAHVNTVFEVDMSAIVSLREAHKVEFQNREGIALTYTPFFAKALVDNVREFPVFNSSVSGENIIYRKPVNLGIAVALDNGLIVPFVKDAHLMSTTGLALAIYDLADRARS